MLKKARAAVAEHPVAAVLFWIPFVGAALAASVVTGTILYRRHRDRKHLEKLAAHAPSIDELPGGRGLLRRVK